MSHTNVWTLALLLAASSTAWAQTESQRLFANDPEDFDAFGWCVDIVDDKAAVGSLGEDDACPGDPLNCNSGVVYAYAREGDFWIESGRLTASDAASGDQFGQDVSIWGNRIVVGAHQNGPGAVYVFHNIGLGWFQEQMLVGSDSLPTYHFGHSVSIVGQSILVGTMRDQHAGFDSGSAFRFEFNGTSWVETAKLTASNPQVAARFGRAIASTEDWAIVGAPFMDQTGTDSGAVYTFIRDENGTPSNRLDDLWPETQILTGSDTDDDDLFGRAIAIEGNTMVVTAALAEVGGVATGAAYVFEFQASTGTWVQVQKLSAADADLDDQFGMCVEIDGDRMLIGARRDDEAGDNAGAVYLFERPPGSVGAWLQTAKILATDPTTGAAMGDEMAVSLWGKTAFIGARFSGSAGELSGEAYVVDLESDIGSDYCTVTPNSTGQISTVTANGSRLAAANNLTLNAIQLPTDQFGYFLASTTDGFVGMPGNSLGNLCLSGSLGRYVSSIFNTGADGVAAQVVDTSAIPNASAIPSMAMPGDSFYFQAWHRDFVGGASVSNFTEPVEVTFL